MGLLDFEGSPTLHKSFSGKTHVIQAFKDGIQNIKSYQLTEIFYHNWI